MGFFKYGDCEARLLETEKAKLYCVALTWED